MTGSHTAEELEAMAAVLEATGQYRVLRKLSPRSKLEPADGAPTRTGLFVDVETTGLDPLRHEIIELAMVPFTYGQDGRIFEVGDPFHELRQPLEPIPPEITAITGISDDMVAGKVIDPAQVATFAAPAALVVAHNAAFDRRFLERFCDTFTTKPWACSMIQVPWAEEGHEGVKLTEMGVRVHCLALGGVDLTSSTGKLTMNVINAVAEFERDQLVERTQADLARAKAQGKTLGRPSSLAPESRAEIERRLADGASVSALARAYKTSRQSILRVKRAMDLA